MSVKSLVKSTLLLGSTSAATAIVGMLRVKVLALLLGPAGLGLLGALAGLASVGTTLFACGADTSGTRRLALNRGSPGTIAHLRRVMLLIAAVHGTVAVAGFWLARDHLSRWIFGSDQYTTEVACLGLVVALALLAGLQIALLQGLGEVRKIAKVNLTSSVIATCLGLLAVYLWGAAGIIVLLLGQPAIAALLASALAPRSPSDRNPGEPRPPVASAWRGIIGEGFAFMVSYLMLALVPFAVRTLIIHELGLEAAGHFHAAWTMSVIYVGFLLNAMSADYFPRLTGLVADPPRAIALINDQVQVGLAIGGPILLVMLAGAPWIVPLLYSKHFAAAVPLVEWQALGNLMKIAGWPVAFLSMARGRSVQFLLLEVAWTSLYFLLVWVGLAHLGLPATGIAFAVACCAFFALQYAVARLTYGFRWRSDTLAMLFAYTVAGGLTLLAAQQSAGLQAAVGAVSAVTLGLAGVRQILGRTGGAGRAATMANRIYARIGWPVRATASAGTG